MSKVFTDEQWESLCDGCAGCCHIGDGIACPSLGDDKRCTVYENRLDVELCFKVTPTNTMRLNQLGILPDTCAYVQTMKGEDLEPGVYPLIPFKLAPPDIAARRTAQTERYLERRRERQA